MVSRLAEGGNRAGADDPIVVGQQRGAQNASRGHDDPVGGIAVKGGRQCHRFRGNGGRKGDAFDQRRGRRVVQPLSERQTELDPGESDVAGRAIPKSITTARALFSIPRDASATEASRSP